MRREWFKLSLLGLFLVMLVNCGEVSRPDDAGPWDSKASENQVGDGPLLDKSRMDGPTTDAQPVDTSVNDLVQDKAKTDVATCTASNTVWGQFKWDEGCVWQ